MGEARERDEGGESVQGRDALLEGVCLMSESPNAKEEGSSGEQGRVSMQPSIMRGALQRCPLLPSRRTITP